MKRGILIFSACVAVTSFSFGLIAARGMQSVAFDMGRLHSSAEWTRQMEEVERQLNEDGAALVGTWRLRLENKDPNVARVKRRPAVKRSIGGGHGN